MISALLAAAGPVWGVEGVVPVVTTGYSLDRVTITLPTGETETIDNTQDAQGPIFLDALGSGTAILRFDLPPIDGAFSIQDDSGRTVLEGQMKSGFMVDDSIVQPQRPGDLDLQTLSDYLQGPLPTDVRAGIWNFLDGTEQNDLDGLFDPAGYDSARDFIYHLPALDLDDPTTLQPTLFTSRDGRRQILATPNPLAGGSMTGLQWAEGVGGFFANSAANVEPQPLAIPETNQGRAAARSPKEREQGASPPRAAPTIRVLPFGVEDFKGHLPAVGDEQPFVIEVSFPNGQLPLDETGIVDYKIDVQLGFDGAWSLLGDSETVTLYLDDETMTYRNLKPITAKDGGEDTSWGTFAGLNVDNGSNVKVTYGGASADLAIFDNPILAQIDIYEQAFRQVRQVLTQRILNPSTTAEEKAKALLQTQYIDHYFFIAAHPVVMQGTEHEKGISNLTMREIAAGYLGLLKNPYGATGERGVQPKGATRWGFTWATIHESQAWGSSLARGKQARTESFNNFTADLAMGLYEWTLEMTITDNIMVLADADPTRAPNPDGSLRSTDPLQKVGAGLDLGLEVVGMGVEKWYRNNWAGPTPRTGPRLRDMDGGNYPKRGTPFGRLTDQQVNFNRGLAQGDPVPSGHVGKLTPDDVATVPGGVLSGPPGGSGRALPDFDPSGTLPPGSLPTARGPPYPGVEIEALEGGGFRLTRPGGKREIEIGPSFGDPSSFTTAHGVQGSDHTIAKLTKPPRLESEANAAVLDDLGYNELGRLDPTKVEIPEIHSQFTITTPGPYEGYTLTFVKRAPASFRSAKDIKTATGDMTPGQLRAYQAGMDELNSHSLVLVDNHHGNYGFRPIGAPEADEWRLVLFDQGSTLKMDSPGSAFGLRWAIDNPDPAAMGGLKTWMIRPDIPGQRLYFSDHLAEQFDAHVDWDYLFERTGQRYTTLGYAQVEEGGVQFPYNPVNGTLYENLRIHTAQQQAAAALAGIAPGSPSPTAPLPYFGRGYGSLTGQLLVVQPGTVGQVDTNQWDAFESSLPVDMQPYLFGTTIFAPCAPSDPAACPDSTAAVQFSFPQDLQIPIDGFLVANPYIFNVEPNAERLEQGTKDPYLLSVSSWSQSYEDQWAIRRVGLENGSGTTWERVKRDGAPVVVAVIDTGLAWNHEDFQDSNLWINDKEIPGNGIDDDGNGYVDDIVGWNFIEQTNIPWDLDGHGTLVAGIIAATSDNGIGIAGINPHARIMVLQALDAAGRTRASILSEAIVYATNNGARIINLSVGGKSLTRIEELAVAYAHERGAFVVTAAGNEASDLSDYGPAGTSRAFTVAATDPDDARLRSSNWGRAVDLAAPGVDVLGLRAIGTDLMAKFEDLDYRPQANIVGADKGYYRATGSSFAAPIVAGVASLLLSQNPGLSNEDLGRILRQSARDIEVPGVDQYTGYGLVDAEAALAADPQFFVEASISGVTLVREGGVPYLQVQGSARADRFKRSSISIGKGEDPSDWREIASIAEPVSSGALANLEVGHFAGAPQWTLRLVVEHQGGAEREARFVLNLN